MKTKYKFIHFEINASRLFCKDKPMWYVKNNRTTATLGIIDWYQPWRQYCFSPFHNTIFNDSRLADIQHFIGQLKEEKP